MNWRKNKTKNEKNLNNQKGPSQDGKE